MEYGKLTIAYSKGRKACVINIMDIMSYGLFAASAKLLKSVFS
jgi:hypothetical protein